MTEPEELRLHLADDPDPEGGFKTAEERADLEKLVDEPAPPRKIRYIFTVAMPMKILPDHPLAQRVYLTETIERLKALGAETVGVVAVMEEM